MGYKVYTGFKAFRACNPDFGVFMEGMKVWRRRVRDLVELAVADYLARKATDRHDRRLLDPVQEEDEGRHSPLSYTWWNMLDDINQHEAKQLRHPETDFDFKIGLDIFEGRLYGRVFTEHSEWLAEFLKLPGIEPFAFYDGTDPPKDVPKRIWKERRRVWHAIGEQPGRDRVVIEIDCNPNPVPMPSDAMIDAAIPAFDKRVRRLAIDRVWTARVREIVGRPDAPSDFGPVIEAGEWVRSPEGEIAVAAESEKIGILLPRNLDVATLKRDPTPLAIEAKSSEDDVEGTPAP